MKKFHILLVDDEARILKFLVARLRASGYEVTTAGDGEQALEQVREQEPDLVVLDLILPGKSGLQTLEELRLFSAVPVIVLSARGTDADKIKGLDLGADDYLSKPFNPEELVARIEAVRRRLEHAEGRKTPELLSLPGLTIDFKRHSVRVNNKEQHLTRIEWLLLRELAFNAGRLMLYEDLLIRIWGVEYRDDVQLLRTWVSRLRYKIEKDPENPVIIRNIAKTGYIMDHPAS